MTSLRNGTFVGSLEVEIATDESFFQKLGLSQNQADDVLNLLQSAGQRIDLREFIDRPFKIHRGLVRRSVTRFSDGSISGAKAQ